MGDKPTFVARKFQDAQKLAAKGFSCPLCPDTFYADPKLWEHAKRRHQQELGLADGTDEEKVRKRFRHEAAEKAHKGFRRVIRDQAPIGSKPSSNDNDSMKPNIGEDVRSRSPRGRPPIPGSAQVPRKRIDDLGKLTLEQGHLTESSPEATKLPSPPSSPLKREALLGSEFPEPHMDDNTRPARSRAHYAKTTFGSRLVARNDFDRERPPTTDPDFARNSLGSIKRLFDPERDSPFSKPIVTKSERLEEPQVLISHGAVVFVDSENYRMQPNPKPGGNDPYQGYEVEEDPTRHPNGPGNTRSDRRNQSATSSTPSSDMDQDQASDTDPILLLQPETRPISHDQLVVEVKGIYAGLVMVESKCMDVDEKQLNAALEKDKSLQTRLSNEQWQALIHLHKTLLHEHHDFFLASQHPSASPALSHLASKCSMPSRMWQRAIYAFLEVLRHRLPESRDHMLAFINIAYSMMALLYETVPAFEDTWIECLGDLARYRMAVEADDAKDREVWSGVARFWYDKATDHNPNTGRLYHHSAILARQYSLQQLSLFTRSLTCFTPFESAREGIKSLFNGVLSGKAPINPRSSSFETIFIKAHGILYFGLSGSQFHDTVGQMKSGLLNSYIGRVTSKFKEQGVYAMLTNIGALFEYGVLRVRNLAKSVFRLAYEETRHLKSTSGNSASQSSGDNVFDLNCQAKENGQALSPPIDSTIESLTTKEVESSVNTISLASELTFTILTISLRRIGDGNVYPLVHVALVFLFSLANVDKAMKYVEKDIPWGDICSFLNALARPEVLTAKVWSKEFPKPENGVGRPLPEDFAMRGQMYTQSFFPENWFSNDMINDEERLMEFPSLAAPRVERILWLGARIASTERWFFYDESQQSFVLTDTAINFADAAQHAGDGEPGADLTLTHERVVSDVEPSRNAIEDTADDNSDLLQNDSDAEHAEGTLLADETVEAARCDAHSVEARSEEQARETILARPANPTTVSWLEGNVLDRAKGPPMKSTADNSTSVRRNQHHGRTR